MKRVPADPATTIRRRTVTAGPLTMATPGSRNRPVRLRLITDRHRKGMIPVTAKVEGTKVCTAL